MVEIQLVFLFCCFEFNRYDQWVNCWILFMFFDFWLIFFLVLVFQISVCLNSHWKKMGVMSRRVVPVCGNLCFFCPSMRARSRQPVKRYKKLLSDIFPRNQVLFSAHLLPLLTLILGIFQLVNFWFFE